MVRKRQNGFTLIEVLVVIVLVSLSLVAVMNAFRAIGQADTRARDAELLQRLVALKMDEIGSTGDPQTMEDSGDFTDAGYPQIEWHLDVQASGTENIDQVTVTAQQGDSQQSLMGLVFVRPQTTGATTPTGTGGGATTP